MTNSPDRNGASSAIVCEDLAELARARREAINLVQWPARVANSYVTSSASERRTDLEFCTADNAFVTQQFADGAALEMRLPDLRLQFLHNGKPVPHVFDPQERSPAEAEAWILVELLHRGIDREKFSKKLPYAIPGLLTGDAEDYAPQACREGLSQLTAWFGKAAAVLEAAARARGLDKANIICLPQTLDLVFTPLGGAKSGAKSGVKFIPLGFSPGDTENSEPYFYTGDAATSASPKAPRAIVSGSKLLAQGDAAHAAATLLKMAAA
jgi:hypothetical protein